MSAEQNMLILPQGLACLELSTEQAGNGLLAPKLCQGLPGRYRCGRVRGWSSAEGFSVILTLLQAHHSALPL